MGVAELLLKKKQELAAKNLEEGKIYLENFAKEQNVIVLPSGVLYKILQKGAGNTPANNSKVRCHYHGINTNNDVFDSSVEKGKPAEFHINKLIKGWQQVMPLLNTGTKAKIVIPPEYAYGKEQISKQIGPNSTLIFEVELLDIL